MQRWASISLTVVAAVSMAAGRQQQLDPCEAASFNEQACQAAIPSRRYCWSGRWVRLKYHFPYPYFYNAYQEYLANGGVVNAAAVGSCGPSFPCRLWISRCSVRRVRSDWCLPCSEG